MNQGKKLSKVFNVSLDELTCNDINNVLVERVSNTEKLAGIVIKVLKIIGLGILIMIIFNIIIFIAFFFLRTTNNEVLGQYIINCQIDEEQYHYEIEFNKKHKIITINEVSPTNNYINTSQYSDARNLKIFIEDYFEKHNGSCDIKKENY